MQEEKAKLEYAGFENSYKIMAMWETLPSLNTFVHEAAMLMDEMKIVNYIEAVGVDPATFKKFVITIRRAEGLTPHEKHLDTKAKLDALVKSMENRVEQ